MAVADEIRKFDEAELADWLEEKDIPREFCVEFESKSVWCMVFLFFFGNV